MVFNPPQVEGVCDKCGGELYQRDDDSEATVRNRLEVYQQQTEPLIDYYDAQAWSARIDGAKAPDDVYEDIRHGPRTGGCLDDSDHPEVTGGDREDGPRRGGGPGLPGPAGPGARPGVTTRELDQLAEKYIRAKGGVPTFKGYRGFPGSICASPNDMVVHGIPGKVRLSEGDILGVDVGVTLDGYIADAAMTFPVGEISEEARRLLRMPRGVAHAGHRAVQSGQSGRRHLARRAVLRGSSRVLGGAEPGRSRCRPGHARGPAGAELRSAGRGPSLREGMVLAIEPMINVGGHDVEVGADGWAIYTRDGSLSAHFEHTVAITDSGPRILTGL